MLAMQRQLEKGMVNVSRSKFVEEMGKTNRQTAVIYTALFRDRTESFLKGKKWFLFWKVQLLILNERWAPSFIMNNQDYI